MYDTIKCNKIFVMTSAEIEENVAEKNVQNVFKKTTAEHISNLMKGINLHIQEAQQNLRRLNAKRSKYHCLLAKILKQKDKNLQNNKKKHLAMHKRPPQ